ncbi:MAG: FkbM family methyltransferase [Chloroflexi bacterium]|nr:FkbM family methyltransferase [Chloroflexota bacterium]
MRTLDASLRLYRKTLKRIRPAHVALHRLASGLILPGLERASDFKTIADDPFWFRLELLTRRLESDTRRVLERLTAPGMVALDIGAHIGYHTRLLARLVGNTGRVIALQLAVADKPGSAELHDYLMMSASSSLHYDETLARQQQAQMGADDVAPRVLAGFEPQTYRVRAIAIDDCLAEWGIDRVDIIKMDIEGAELTALRGMRRAIRRSPDLALVMEYNPSALQAFGHAPTAVLDAARGLGGRAALIERETARLLAGMGMVNLLLRR